MVERGCIKYNRVMRSISYCGLIVCSFAFIVVTVIPKLTVYQLLLLYFPIIIFSLAYFYVNATVKDCSIGRKSNIKPNGTECCKCEEVK